jgi:hypothetical protein
MDDRAGYTIMTEHQDEARDAALMAAVLNTCSRLSADMGHDDICRLAHGTPLPDGDDPVPALLGILCERSDIVRTVADRDVLREIDWSKRDENGVRRYPDMPETEIRFESEQGLALLLLNEVVFLNSHHWEDEWPAEARAAAYLGVNCSDVFAWGCSDAEGAAYSDLEAVYRHWRKDPHWGTAVWCMIKRREMPQRPVEKRIRDAGIWDLDALAAEHGLRPNHYDGISGVWAAQKYEAYCAWERSEGRDPLPFDAGWWGGWKRYVAARPDWNDAAWKAEEQRRSDAWRVESGHVQQEDTPPVPDAAAEARSLSRMLAAVTERRTKAAAAAKDMARTYFTQEADRTERDVLARLPALLAALGDRAP